MSDTLKFSQSTIMHHFNLQWLSSASVPRREQARLISGESLAVRDSARSDDKTNERLAGFQGLFCFHHESFENSYWEKSQNSAVTSDKMRLPLGDFMQHFNLSVFLRPCNQLPKQFHHSISLLSGGSDRRKTVWACLLPDAKGFTLRSLQLWSHCKWWQFVAQATLFPPG